MQSKEIIEILERDEGVNFLREFYGQNPEKIALNKTIQPKLSKKTLLQILHLYHKAESKLPSFVANYCALSSKSYEQSSSELTAQYKSKLFSGKRMLNLTGGIGVDDIFMSNYYEELISLEIDKEIHQMAVFNMKKLNAGNVKRIHCDSVDYIQNLNENSFDLIYIDPDRRPTKSKRNYFLEDTLPNVIELEDLLLKIAPKVLIKASPMLDIKRACDQLKSINKVWVVSVRNEVKELLFLCEPIKNRSTNSIEIKAVNLANSKTYEFTPHDIHFSNVEHETGSIFVEMGAAVIKAGLTSPFANQFGLKQVFKNSAYAYSEKKINNGLLRQFKVLEKHEFSKKNASRLLKKHHITKANISKRNFPISVDQIYQNLKLKNGGTYYLFFYKDDKQKKWMVISKKC